ncbi:MAG: hypothetical protein ACD_21C00187G0002 [uncultured bacterium]|nr:MAG: hypothetical protein ACD_21C00187G0002 [uncultured bacterium]
MGRTVATLHGVSLLLIFTATVLKQIISPSVIKYQYVVLHCSGFC